VAVAGHRPGGKHKLQQWHLYTDESVAAFHRCHDTITTITVQTLSNMNWMDFSNGNSPAVGDTVSVKGLLFNTIGTTGTPTLVTRSIRDHQDDQGGH